METCDQLKRALKKNIVLTIFLLLISILQPSLFFSRLFSEDILCMEYCMEYIPVLYSSTSPKPGTTFYFPKDQYKWYPIKTTEENTVLEIVGELPDGLSWSFQGGNPYTIAIYGSLRESMTVTFTVLARGVNGICNCETELLYGITTNPPPSPPVEVKVEQTERLGGEVTVRSKKCGGVVKYDNVISWKNPENCSGIVKYKIFKDKNFAQPIATVAIQCRKKYKFIDENVDPCKKPRYDLVSVNEIGQISSPVRAKR